MVGEARHFYEMKVLGQILRYNHGERRNQEKIMAVSYVFVVDEVFHVLAEVGANRCIVDR